MTAYDTATPPARRDDTGADTSAPATPNAEAIRAAQAFAASPQMKVLSDIHATRVARRAAR